MNPARTTRRWWRSGRNQMFVLCLVWAAVIALAHVTGLRPLHHQELASLDLRFRLRGARPAAPELVILSIDQRSLVTDLFTAADLAANPDLARLKNYPFPRRVYAAAIARLAAAGARVIAIDLLFLSPKDDDLLLRAAIATNRDRVVLASNFSDDGKQLLLPSVVVPDSIPTASIAGYVNYWPDSDGVVRRVRFATTAAAVAGLPASAAEPVRSSLAYLVTEKYLRTVPHDHARYIDFAGPSGSFAAQPFYELFYEKTFANNLRHGEVFRDKIVLIGPGGNYQHDQHPTPFGPLDGVELHANSIATLLHGTGPRPAPAWLGFVTIVACALVTARLLNTRSHPLLKLLWLALAGGIYFAAATAAFAAAGRILLVAAPLWTVAGGGVFGIALQVAAERLEQLRVRRTLEKYVSRPVAAEILRHSDEYETSLGGERKAVTILFSDIRDFTTLSERTSPLELVQQLNEYFTEMVAAVMEHNGTLDKFIGDAIMAVWGAPRSAGAAADAWQAVQTACAMRDRLAVLQKNWAAHGRAVFRIGIGLNHGEVLVGNIGSPQRMEYTVIGDAVNVASRVEGLNKNFHTDILITESVYTLVNDRIEARLIGEAAVKGRAQPLNVYALEKLRTAQ